MRSQFFFVFHELGPDEPVAPYGISRKGKVRKDVGDSVEERQAEYVHESDLALCLFDKVA